MNTTHPTGARLSVSTWSLHRSLGRPPFSGPSTPRTQSRTPTAPAQFSLLELPAHIAAEGIRTLEICHFHLPSCDAAYLQSLRNAIENAGVELWSLLIDEGDITDLLHAERDMAWIKEWLDVASALGARNARVIAGKAHPTPETLTMSRRNLATLAAYARSKHVRVMTENWLNLTATPESVLYLMEHLGDEIGLCVDFGNWRGENKYADLTRILSHADSCHSKAHFDADRMDRTDFVRCLALAQAAGFAGPHTLIYDGPNDDEFAGLRQERDVVKTYLV